MPAVQETVEQVRRIDVDQYKYGFETLIESEKAPKGLSGDTVRFISAKKNEPEWMLAWRLDAYKRWLTMREPKWAKVEYGPINYQDIYYYAAPKKKDGPKSCAPTRSWAFHCASRKSCSAYRTDRPARMTALTAKPSAAMAALLSTLYSIQSRWPPRSRPSWRKPACSSCRSRKRCSSIPTS